MDLGNVMLNGVVLGPMCDSDGGRIVIPMEALLNHFVYYVRVEGPTKEKFDYCRKCVKNEELQKIEVYSNERMVSAISNIIETSWMFSNFSGNKMILRFSTKKWDKIIEYQTRQKDT
jgi:hypothetical protein